MRVTAMAFGQFQLAGKRMVLQVRPSRGGSWREGRRDTADGRGNYTISSAPMRSTGRWQYRVIVDGNETVHSKTFTVVVQPKVKGSYTLLTGELPAHFEVFDATGPAVVATENLKKIVYGVVRQPRREVVNHWRIANLSARTDRKLGLSPMVEVCDVSADGDWLLYQAVERGAYQDAWDEIVLYDLRHQRAYAVPTPADSVNYCGTVSADGQIVTYSTDGADAGTGRAMVWDRGTDAITPAPVGMNAGDYYRSSAPLVTNDGRTVVYTSEDPSTETTFRTSRRGTCEPAKFTT